MKTHILSADGIIINQTERTVKSGPAGGTGKMTAGFFKNLFFRYCSNCKDNLLRKSISTASKFTLPSKQYCHIKDTWKKNVKKIHWINSCFKKKKSNTKSNIDCNSIMHLQGGHFTLKSMQGATWPLMPTTNF